jgi:Ferritin-like domain
VTVSINRASFLSRGAKSGAALLVAGAAVGSLAETAAADPIGTNDLANVRLLVTWELLASNFYSQAVAASNTSTAVMKYLQRAYLNEQEHYQSVAGILSGSGNTPAVSGDVTFAYPKGTFDSQTSIISAAVKLENAILGTYLGVIGTMVNETFSTGLASMAACEAQHASYFTDASGGKIFDLSFPPWLTIEASSNLLDGYTA